MFEPQRVKCLVAGVLKVELLSDKFVTGVGALPVQGGQGAKPLRFFSSFLDVKKGTASRGVSDKEVICGAKLLSGKSENMCKKYV